MGKPWLLYEDELLKTAEKKIEKGNWVKISAYIDGRSALACQTRWEQISAVKPTKGNPEKLRKIPLGWVYPQGDWSRIPLLPFLHICSFLDYRQIFWILPLVCQHFRIYLDQNQVPVESLTLNNTTNLPLLVMLNRKISTCKALGVNMSMRMLHVFWRDCLTTLITKFQKTLVRFECITSNEGPVIELLNGCTKLRYLTLLAVNRKKPWRWNKVKVCSTLIDLTYADTCNHHGNLEGIFPKYPALVTLILRNSLPRFIRETTEREDLVIPRLTIGLGQIEVLQSAYLPACRHLQRLKQFVFPCKTYSSMKLMMKYLPLLKGLELLVVRVPSIMLAAIDAPAFPNCVLDFLNALKLAPAMNNLTIEKTYDHENFESPKIDATVLEILNLLPERVKKISYKKSIVRPKSIVKVEESENK